MVKCAARQRMAALIRGSFQPRQKRLLRTKPRSTPQSNCVAQTTQNWRTAGTARTRGEQRTPLESPAQPLDPGASAYYRSLRHAIEPAEETIGVGHRAAPARASNTRPAEEFHMYIHW